MLLPNNSTNGYAPKTWWDIPPRKNKSPAWQPPNAGRDFFPAVTPPQYHPTASSAASRPSTNFISHPPQHPASPAIPAASRPYATLLPFLLHSIPRITFRRL